jgi:hypothetical protein
MDDLWLLEETHSDVRLEFGLAEAEIAAAAIARATSAQMRAIVDVLDEARRHPGSFIVPQMIGRMADEELRSYAERAAAADLATRIGMAEGTVFVLAHQGRSLLRAAPRVWAAFRDGGISAPNARALADRVADVPESRWRELDEAALTIAGLAPARFAGRLRTVVERLATEPLAVRHRRAAERRRVCVDPDRDGMAWLGFSVPDEAAARVMARLNEEARRLSSLPGETRTRDQLRADIAVDLLTTGPGGESAVRATVLVTVPVLTLLGCSDEPATLDGVTPIDAQRARQIAAEAPSFHRILTHPVSSAVLDLDRTSYRVPADLRRAVQAQHPRCVFAGCGRRARDSDLDHSDDWADGGVTSFANLAPLCRHHHRLKHVTRWRYRRVERAFEWTSPTGAVHRSDDPPPF